MDWIIEEDDYRHYYHCSCRFLHWFNNPLLHVPVLLGAFRNQCVRSLPLRRNLAVRLQFTCLARSKQSASVLPNSCKQVRQRRWLDIYGGYFLLRRVHLLELLNLARAPNDSETEVRHYGLGQYWAMVQNRYCPRHWRRRHQVHPWADW